MDLDEVTMSQGLTVWPQSIHIHSAIDPSVILSAGLVSRPGSAGSWMWPLLPDEALHPLDAAESLHQQGGSCQPQLLTLDFTTLRIACGINFYSV